jgi:hypothetical protein
MFIVKTSYVSYETEGTRWIVPVYPQNGHNRLRQACGHIDNLNMISENFYSSFSFYVRLVVVITVKGD